MSKFEVAVKIELEHAGDEADVYFDVEAILQSRIPEWEFPEIEATEVTEDEDVPDENAVPTSHLQGTKPEPPYYDEVGNEVEG